MIYEEYTEMSKRPIDVKLAVDVSGRFKNVYHFHPGIEIIFVHEGKGTIIIEQEVYQISPGTLLLIRPYQPHFLQMNISKSQPYVRSLIKFEPDFISDFFKPFSYVSQFHHYLCHAPSILQVQQHLKSDLLDQFLKVYSSKLDHHLLFEERMIEKNVVFLMAFYQFIQPMWEERAQEAQLKAGADPIIVQIMKWIEEHYQEEFQLDALAKAIHLSPNHISYLFQKSTGYTITAFLTVRRMKHAAMLLKTTSLKIEEIGRRCGYSNYSYFCQVFKKNMGTTPARYRAT